MTALRKDAASKKPSEEYPSYFSLLLPRNTNVPLTPFAPMRKVTSYERISKTATLSLLIIFFCSVKRYCEKIYFLYYTLFIKRCQRIEGKNAKKRGLSRALRGSMYVFNRFSNKRLAHFRGFRRRQSPQSSPPASPYPPKRDKIPQIFPL